MIMLKRLAPALTVLLLASTVPVLFAQNAQVGGRVTDPSGAVIPGTEISVVNADTGVERKTASNDEGYYAVPLLQPGRYRLTAQKEGFKPLSRDGILLQVGDRVTLNLAMEVGVTTETVTVTAEVPLLRTEDAQTGLVIDNRRIMQLPQYNRNPLAFAQLAPNVNGASEQGAYGSDFRVNGGRTNQTEYIIDGIPVTTGYKHDVPPAIPSMEAVAEFKVITNGLSAEYGRLSGGAVVLASRSGTNEYHGQAYWYFKNDKLNANSWNANRFGRTKGVFHDNVFGGALGGPVAIPKLYNGRDRTFFFVNHEGVRHSEGSNVALANVPTSLERQGDFSQSLIDNGRPVQIYDWTTGRIVNGRVNRDPFPGNRIPQARFDELAKIFMGYYPQPNQAARPGSTSDQNYIYSSTSAFDSGRWTGRLDQNWSSAHTTHVSVNWFNSLGTTPRTFSPLQQVGVTDIAAKTVSLGHTWMWTPVTIVNLRAGLVRQIPFSGSEVDVDTSGWPLQPEVRNLIGTTRNRSPRINIDGGPTALGGGQVSDERDTGYLGGFDVQKIHGKHTFKAGYEHRRYYTNAVSGGTFAVSTNRITTALGPDYRTESGSPFASFLLGNVIWGTGQQISGPASLQTYHGAYLQDDFKISSKLTLNFGLRWDLETPRTERFNRQIFWDRNYKWSWTPAAGWSWAKVEQAIGQSLPQPEWMTAGIPGRVAVMGTPEYPGRTLEKTHYDHFGPRVGFAYQFLPRTVLRASYGMLWMTGTGNWHLSSARWNVGYGDFARLAQDGTPDGGLTYPLSFTVPMPGRAGYVPASRDVLATNMSVMGNWWLSQTDLFSPGYEHAIMLSLQREIGAGANSWVVEAAFNGNFGRNLPVWIGNGEHVLPDAYHKIGPLGSKLLTPVPNPFYGQIPAGSARGGNVVALGNLYQLNPLWQQISTTGDAGGTSNYSSGYVQAEHRFGNGFSFLANYTLSKLMEDTGSVDHSSPGSARFFQAGLGRWDVYSEANSYSRHRLILNYSVELPFGRGKPLLGSPASAAAKALEKVAGGWILAGTMIARSGVPLRIQGTNGLWWNAGHASNGDSERPVFVHPRVQFDNQVSGHQALEGAAGFTPYLNRDAFRRAEARPDILEVGDTAWVLPVRGPGFSQWDFSLLKNISLGAESRYLQLRFEAQNFLNHMNAGNPDINITSRTFGMITSQSGSPRVAMIAAKIYF
jgi:outer membrane receptor protein involved in Fe transport